MRNKTSVTKSRSSAVSRAEIMNTLGIFIGGALHFFVSQRSCLSASSLVGPTYDDNKTNKRDHGMDGWIRGLYITEPGLSGPSTNRSHDS